MRGSFLFGMFILGVGILFGFIFVSRNTYAYSYEVDELILFYEEDKERLESNIKLYLEEVDDLLIANSKYDYSEVLVENYDFLVYFAMDYILRYYESYQERIKIGDEFTYRDKIMASKISDRYVSLEDVYEITDKYFGVRDFAIINHDVVVVDDNISLIDYTEELFLLNIEDVIVNVQEDMVYANVYYEGGQCLVYRFLNQLGVLKLKNIEVLSWRSVWY